MRPRQAVRRLTLSSQAVGSWLAALAAGLALQSAPLAAAAAERCELALLQAPALVDRPGEHNCRPRCIWGDAVCRALLGERWSDTGERCDSLPDLPDLAPELRGDDDAPPPYVSAPPLRDIGCV